MIRISVPTRSRSLVAMAMATLLAACGGGGGGGGTSSSPTALAPTTPAGPSYTQGVFERASLFENRCQAPRTGRDTEGNIFPDRAGSLLEEMFWLRSWTNETYLWNTDVPDRNPSGFTDKIAYFDLLKTNEITPSGEQLDDFHFSQPTDEFLEARNSAPQPGYGVRFTASSTSPPRDFRVELTEPGTPASQVVNGQPNLVRGSRLLEINGADFVNGTGDAVLDTLNAGLFPETVGETHTFVVQDPASTSPRTITLVSANVSTTPVNRVSTIARPDGTVGYLLVTTFNPFSSEEQLADAMTTLSTAGVTDLVLDLRYNGGGLLSVAAQLSYMIAGPARTSGRTFEQLQFNASAGNRNPVTGGSNAPIPFHDTGLGFTLPNGAALPTLNLQTVYILSTGRTCSASEAIINGLRGIGVDVVLIGDVTCGKPYGFYPTDNCGTTYFTIQFRGVNDAGFGDYADGFVPANSGFAFGERLNGCVVADDFSKELGDETEALLAAALAYRDTGTCPPTPSSPAGTTMRRLTESAATGEDIPTTLASPAEELVSNNRDMRMPY